jgi:hypothetical protein
MRSAFRVIGVVAVVVLGFAAGAPAATPQWLRLPVPAGGPVVPYQVSCASPIACFALGTTGPEKFIRYTGTRATRLAGPQGERSATISALSCGGLKECVAVGSTNQSADHGLLALRWSDRHWTTTRLPAGLGRSLTQAHYELTGLSCPATTRCIAVGQVVGITTKTHAAVKPLLLSWNGQRWSSVRSPLTTGTLRSVSCEAALVCTVVGAEHQRPAVLSLDAGQWTRVPLSLAVSRAVGSSLTSISCPTFGNCLATGLINVAPHAAVPVTRVVALQENRGVWSTEVPPAPAPRPGAHSHT